MVSVKVTTAVKLTDSQVTTIEKAVAKSHPQTKLEFVYVVEPSVIGGIKLTIGSRELDGTVKNKLTTIKNQLLTNL